MSRVSVIIPAYDAAATITQAIDSALAQTLEDCEVIVVNDGSTDATAAILRRYADRITVIDQPNGGISKARNAALKVATGEFVALLDADDVWHPEMLARTVPGLENDPAATLAFTDLAIIDSVGKPLNTTLVGPESAHAPTLAEMLTRLWPIMPSAVVMRRAVLEQIGGFSEEFNSYGYEDAYCWIRAREHGHFQYVAEPLVYWRFSLYPRPLKKMRGKPGPRAIFARLLQERYGASATPLISSRMRAPRSILGYIGLSALNDGDVARARGAFVQALAVDPLRLKNYLRLLRTFLPAPLARGLGGRTSRPLG
jgi:hypothetical protein